MEVAATNRNGTAKFATKRNLGYVTIHQSVGSGQRLMPALGSIGSPQSGSLAEFKPILPDPDPPSIPPEGLRSVSLDWISKVPIEPRGAIIQRTSYVRSVVSLPARQASSIGKTTIRKQSPYSIVRELLNVQGADGGFEYEDVLRLLSHEVCGITGQLGLGETNLSMTIVVVAFLEKKLPECSSFWALLVKKARKYLVKYGWGLRIDGRIAQAKSLIKAMDVGDGDTQATASQGSNETNEAGPGKDVDV
jgi:hypothetical protein